METPSGMLTTRGKGFQVGEEMHVSVRPEHLEYGLAPAEGFDLPAILKDFTYMGTVVKTAIGSERPAWRSNSPALNRTMVCARGISSSSAGTRKNRWPSRSQLHREARK